ncbi:uncharacterized mitochondrial protein AtMg00810-like [Lactuca sativa]|uniref:uncharacterized mitochondrial protein AtMg00810-like n=1 Tax=Lactuca sativa TaxID=4236 RepID=UPI000CD825B2|nr:uncharacterized mitochondrial protein AtMg00810-like [Lactuca sativa]
MLKKFSFADCKRTKMPMFLTRKIFVDHSGKDVNPSLYRGMIGSLLYLTTSPLDILFVSSMCARFEANLKESHILIVKWFFRYLKYTPNPGLWYPHDSDFNLLDYTDSDYIVFTLDKKSTSGECQLLGNRLISWSSKKQSSLACSTTKA